MMHRSTRFYLWLVVIGLLAFFSLRIHQLDVIPLFIDESINIERSVNIINGTYLEHARTGKFLLPYYSLIFQPDTVAVWSVRLSILLLTCLGVASGTAIARRYAGNAAGLLTIVLITFSPMLFLFDRFALSDTLLHVTITVWVLSLFRLYDSPRFRLSYAFISGGLFVISMLAKAPTLFLAPLPLVFVLLISQWTIRARIQSLVTFYGTVLVLWLPFTLLLSTRQIDYFGKSDHIAPSLNSLFNIERIVDNLSFMLGGVVTYQGSAFLITGVIMILLAMRHKPGVLLSLSAGIVGYGMAIVLLGGYGLFIRYYTPLMPLLMISISIASITLIQTVHHDGLRKFMLVVLSLGVLLWIIVHAVPFIVQIYNDPPNAPLVSKDRSEYTRANSSGYGIVELADYLVELADTEPLVVEGAFVGCYTLTLYIPADADITVQCPNVLSGDRRARYLNRYLPEEAVRHTNYYVVLETQGVVDREEINTMDLVPVKDFSRPGSGVVQLFRSQ